VCSSDLLKTPNNDSPSFEEYSHYPRSLSSLSPGVQTHNEELARRIVCDKTLKVRVQVAIFLSLQRYAKHG